MTPADDPSGELTPPRLAGAPHRSRVGGWPIAITGLVLALIAFELRYTLIPFVFSIVIAFVLEPVMTWSSGRLGQRRWPAATVLSLAIVGGVGFTGYWIATTAFHEIAGIVSGLPQMIQSATQMIVGPAGIDIFGSHYSPRQLTTMAVQGATNLISTAQIALLVQIGAGAIAAIVLTFVLVPYFLISGPRLADGAIWLIPPERRGSVLEMLPALVPMLRRYVVGLICVVLYAIIVAYIGFGPVFHVPAAALLAVVVGCLELIPVVGPVTSLVLIGLTAAQQGGFDAIFLMIYALAIRLSIDNLVGPLALGRSVTVHPVVVIFAFIIGAMLFGVIGLLLAVPTAACIKLILQHYYAEPIDPSGAAEPGPVRITSRGSR